MRTDKDDCKNVIRFILTTLTKFVDKIEAHALLIASIVIPTLIMSAIAIKNPQTNGFLYALVFTVCATWISFDIFWIIRISLDQDNQFIEFDEFINCEHEFLKELALDVQIRLKDKGYVSSAYPCYGDIPPSTGGGGSYVNVHVKSKRWGIIETTTTAICVLKITETQIEFKEAKYDHNFREMCNRRGQSSEMAIFQTPIFEIQDPDFPNNVITAVDELREDDGNI